MYQNGLPIFHNNNYDNRFKRAFAAVLGRVGKDPKLHREINTYHEADPITVMEPFHIWYNILDLLRMLLDHRSGQAGGHIGRCQASIINSQRRIYLAGLWRRLLAQHLLWFVSEWGFIRARLHIIVVPAGHGLPSTRPPRFPK
jgi:hypothetical protein